MAEDDDATTQEVFKYGKQLKVFQVIFVPLLCLQVAWVFADVIVLYHSHGIFESGALVWGALLGLETVGGLYLMRFLSTTQLMCTDDEIVRRNFRGETRLAFSEIDGVGFPSVKSLGGWMTLRAGDETLRVTAALENLDEFVRQVKRGLDAHGREYAYDTRAFADFHETALLGALNIARYRRYKWRIGAGFVSAALLGGFSGWVISHSASLAMFDAVVGFLVVGVCYLAADLAASRKVAEHVRQAGAFVRAEHDLEYDTRLMRILFWTSLPLTLVAIVAFPLWQCG